MSDRFDEELAAFSTLVDVRGAALFVNVCSAAKGSITDGSPLTGAPGQPVQTGALKASWQLEFESPTRALISTDKEYAEIIEDGIGPHGPITIRSAVGGTHSVAQTIAGIDRIIEDETLTLAGGSNA